MLIIYLHILKWLNISTVPFDTDGTQSEPTILTQSGSGSKNNERVLHISLKSRALALPLDGLES